MSRRKLICFQDNISKPLRILSSLYWRSPVVSLSVEDRVVIFSDSHLGDGGRTDDFMHNSELFNAVLEQYYMRKDYYTLFNGDITEELRFSDQRIRRAHPKTFRLFDQLFEGGRFYRLQGNHDEIDEFGDHIPVYPSLILNYNGNKFFVYHGHQTDHPLLKWEALKILALRYIANPLGIKNFTHANNSPRNFMTESNGYNFSRWMGLASIQGHTHRPLFESQSRDSSIRVKIDNLCEIYPTANAEEKEQIRRTISKYKRELDVIKRTTPLLPGLIYNKDYLLPCLFNSGSCIGKKGITAIEIKNGNVYLVYWFRNGTFGEGYFNEYDKRKGRNLGFGYTRFVFRKDSMANIFSRIELLK